MDAVSPNEEESECSAPVLSFSKKKVIFCLSLIISDDLFSYKNLKENLNRLDIKEKLKSENYVLNFIQLSIFFVKS